MNIQRINLVAKEIENALRSVDSHNPGAILLDGSWGSGKTHFWRETIAKNLGRKSIYLSLFGCSSVENIENKLVSAALNNARDEKGFLAKGTQSILKLVKLGPNLFRQLLGKVVENKLDINPEEILAAIDLEINILNLIPEKSVICLDDLERISIPYEELLGLINRLITEKNCKILLICNEEALKKRSQKDGDTEYFEFKEKVVWKTLKWEPDIGNIFEIMTKSLVSESNQEKVLKLKDQILDVYRRSSSQNMRALQRALKAVDQIIGLHNLEITEDHIRFLVSLVFQQTERGRLNVDLSVYYGSRHYTSMHLDKKKYEDLNDDEKESYDFAEKYDEGIRLRGCSKQIHNFILTGVLDEGSLHLELSPESPSKPAVILFKELTLLDWMYSDDQSAKNLMDRAIELLNKFEIEIEIEVLLRIYGYLARIADHIDKPLPDLRLVMEKRILECVKKSEEGRGGFTRGVDTVIEENAINEFIPFLENARRDHFFSTLKENILIAIKKGKEPEIDFGKYSLSSKLIELFGDEEILSEVDKIRTSHPYVFYRFYHIAVRWLSRLEEGKTLIETLRKRLEHIAEKSVDVSFKKQIAKLFRDIN